MDDIVVDETYSKIRNRLLWGIVLASFHFNLGWLVIFPEFIGWWLVASGISHLNHKYNCVQLIKANTFFILYGFLCMIGFASDTLGIINLSKISMLFRTLCMLLEVCGFYELFQGILVKNLCNKGIALSRYLSGYLILSFLAIGMFNIVFYVMFIQRFILAMTVLLILLRLSVMYQIYFNCLGHIEVD